MEQKQLSTSVKKRDKQNSGNKNKKLIKYEQIEGTIFTIISRENIHFISIGNNRVSEETNDKEALKKKVQEKDWGLILNMVSIVTAKIIEEQQKKQTGI